MRRAFADLGHDVWSCDLLPSDDRTNKHIQADIRDVLDEGWDMLVLCHPPCTRLCNSGVRWLSDPPKNAPDAAHDVEKASWKSMTKAEKLVIMWRLLDEGAALFSACWNAPIPMVAVENPVMHKHARARLPADLPQPQIIQPWWFGEQAFKATGFYTRGLPALTPTKKLTPPRPGTEGHKAWSAIHRCPPGPLRWKIRSKTFEGVARACASQWAGPAEAINQAA